MELELALCFRLSFEVPCSALSEYLEYGLCRSRFLPQVRAAAIEASHAMFPLPLKFLHFLLPLIALRGR
jgi:hypothetical protein